MTHRRTPAQVADFEGRRDLFIATDHCIVVQGGYTDLEKAVTAARRMLEGKDRGALLIIDRRSGNRMLWSLTTITAE